jgi:hypothetical protein
MNFSFPTLPNFQISQKWGNVNAAMYPAPSYKHMGVDIAGYTGAPIFAVCDGVVADVMTANQHGYGRSVVIQHAVGDVEFDTLYGHLLSDIRVSAGDEVTAGQQIGRMGGDPRDNDPMDGASSGTHLHFEVILPNQPGTGDGGRVTESVKTWAGYTVDPLPFLTRLAFGEPKMQGKILEMSGVRVRTEKDIFATIIGGLGYQSIVPIMGTYVVGGNTWAQLWSLRPEFAAVEYGGMALMNLTPLPPNDLTPPPPSLPGNGELTSDAERAIRLDEVKRLIALLEKRKAELM